MVVIVILLLLTERLNQRKTSLNMAPYNIIVCDTYLGYALVAESAVKRYLFPETLFACPRDHSVVVGLGSSHVKPGCRNRLVLLFRAKRGRFT